MKTVHFTLLASLVGALLLSGCGQRSEPVGKSGTAGYLPERIDPPGFERASDVETYEGESLYEYIDGGAEIYHQYGFVEVSTALYSREGTEVVADVYAFVDEDNAYGLFSSLRPIEPGIVRLGAEGFASSTTIDFVKGNFLVRLVAYDESPATSSALMSLGTAFDGLLPGRTTLPEMFSLFPSEGRIAATERFHAESFLGQLTLSDVYSIDFLIGDDTVTLFLTTDASGDKFLAWSELAPKHKATDNILSGIPFDSGKVFVSEDPYYGQIIAGSKAQKLCGMIGYDESRRDRLVTWLTSLR